MRRPLFARLRSTSAFTLIELLVVILILAILIAVAAPSFLGQTEKAHESAAKQNLAVAYKALKADAVDSDPQGYYKTDFSLAAALEDSEPQLSVVVGADPGDGSVVVLPESSPSRLLLQATTPSGDVVYVDAEANGEVTTSTTVPSGVTSSVAAQTASSTHNGTQVQVLDPAGGPINITAANASGPAPSGYVFLNAEFDVTGPAATAAKPIHLSFSAGSQADYRNLQVWRNGTLVPNCADASGTASPDPCVVSRHYQAPYGATIVVLTSQFSTWNVGTSSEPADSNPTGSGGSGGGGGDAECSDTLDNDSDGATDYPDDLDCSSASDDSEALAHGVSAIYFSLAAPSPIYSMTATGAVTQRSPGDYEVGLDVSTSGQIIYGCDNNGDFYVEICQAVNASTSTALTSSAQGEQDARYGAFSADGSRIAFASRTTACCGFHTFEIRNMNADGTSHQAVVTGMSAGSGQPGPVSWGPGDKIAYIHNGGQFSVYDPSGPVIRQLWSSQSAWGGPSVWNGDTVYFLCGTSAICAADANSANSGAVVVNGKTLRASLDILGSKLLFACDPAGGSSYRVCTYDTSTSSFATVGAVTSGVKAAKWSPNGNAIVYITDGGGVHLMGNHGGSVEVLAADGTYSSIEELVVR